MNENTCNGGNPRQRDTALLYACPVVCFILLLPVTGCEKKAGAQDTGTAAVPSPVQPDFDPSHFKVDNAGRFKLTTTGEFSTSPELNVTGAVNPDVSRQVQVPSLTTGRIVEIDARLGDAVKKGQLLFKVRSQDVAGAYSNYLQALKNEELTKVQLDRANILFENGAIPKSAVEVAQNAEDDNVVILNAAKEQLGLLGLDANHPTGIVPVFAPIAGIITDQEITNQSGVQALTPPNPFTISDMSHVWILCDVYENDLSQVRLGEYADVRLNGYPDQVLKARIGNIGPILDPSIRTAKVRLELANPGYLRLGMFANATFYGLKKDTYTTVPATAILHLHDRDWVYAAEDNGYFQRFAVVTGNMLPGNIQEIVSGVKPGTRVALNALDLEGTVSQ
jgi:cobalt-zinc-cadmium efflux system membrane fusion protein